MFHYKVKELIKKILFFIALGLVAYGSYLKADQDYKASKIIIESAEKQ